MTELDIQLAQTKFPLRKGGPEVTAILTQPIHASALLVLGHGAGTPIRHSLMEGTANALAEQGVATFRFNYPYSEQGMTTDWQHSLDPIELLLDTVDAAVLSGAEAAPGLPLFVGGRSMSSQVTSLAVAQARVRDVRGVVLLAFPMRWTKLLNNPMNHLSAVPVPTLFVQGDRDHLTDIEELSRVVERLGDKVTLHVAAESDHFFNPPEGSAKTRDEVLAELARVVSDWMNSVIRAQEGSPKHVHHKMRTSRLANRRWPLR